MTDEATTPTASNLPAEAPAPVAPAPDSFAARLKGAREAAGLSKNKARQLLGITQTTLVNYESGATKPSPQKQGSMLRKLREAVAVNPGVIVHDGSKEVFAVSEQYDPESFSGEPDHDPYDPVPQTQDEIENANETNRGGVIATRPGSRELSPLAWLQTLRAGGMTTEEIRALSVASSIADFAERALAEESASAGTEQDSTQSVDLQVKLPGAEPIPETPVGNVYTTPAGELLRRLADDDDRDGAQLIDGRRWFTVGFVPPHPRAAKITKRMPVVVNTPIPTSAPPEPVPAAQEPVVAPVHTETTPEPESPAEAITAGTGKRGWSWWNA